MDTLDTVPFTCVFIDASFAQIFNSAKRCVIGHPDRQKVLYQLEEIWTTENNPNHVLPCLSVRTGLDLFLRVMNFPPGSEIIMSAINIPDMIRVVHHHQLKIVPLDIDIETLAPRIDLLESLITEKTKILLLAHVYGKRFDMTPFIDIAHRHGVYVVEDLAEAFEGFDHVGHPETDLALFSFGVIKFSTAFGGAIAKIRDDALFEKMSSLYHSYPTQSHREYLYKVLKYFFVAICINTPLITGNGIAVLHAIGFDGKGYFVKMLRGFPNQLVSRLRHQPCTALLQTMEERFRNFSAADHALTNAKGDYISERLPDNVTLVGNKAMKKNYWLFPVVVSQPDEVLQVLNTMGVDAYRGATQLSVVEPDNGNPHTLHQSTGRHPHAAKFLIDHVLYLPVNKHVSFATLDTICRRLREAVRICDDKQLPPIKKPSTLKVLSKL